MSRGAGGFPPDWQAREHSGEERTRSNVRPRNLSKKKTECVFIGKPFSCIHENGNRCNAVRRAVCLGISSGSLARHSPCSGCAGLRRRSSCPLVSERLRKCEMEGNCVLGSQSLLQSLRHCCMLCLRLFFLRSIAPRHALHAAPLPARRALGAGLSAR